MNRTLAIGDVHGCYDAVRALLVYARVDARDRIVWLGDYVDRGPDSAKVIEFFLGLPEQSNIFLRGNHEIMMENALRSIDCRRSWAASGGGETWDSYLREFGGSGMEAVPNSHWVFFSALRRYHETPTHVFVHASIDSETEMPDQLDDDLFWGRFESIGPHRSGKHVVCGHTHQESGLPNALAHATCIDTWACNRGWLTCLDVVSGQYFQANQRGEVRQGWLE